jgi:hypothetical protein
MNRALDMEMHILVIPCTGRALSVRTQLPVGCWGSLVIILLTLTDSILPIVLSTIHPAQNKFGPGVQSRNFSCGSIGSGNGHRFISSSLPTVDENVSIHKSMRMLRPFQMVDSWQSGRRYLIGPAALATCPLLQGVTSLSLSKTIKTAGVNGGGGGRTTGMEEGQSCGYAVEKEEENPETDLVSTTISSPQELPPLFGCIVLGNALLSYVFQEPIQHHQQRWWSSSILILRQNYLLEYDQQTGDVLQGLPRGYAHLQYSLSYAHPDFLDALELEFFVSPCAKADKRVVRIDFACKIYISDRILKHCFTLFLTAHDTPRRGQR